MKQKHSNVYKDILFIVISSFILVVIWIGFNIHHVLVTSTIDEKIQLHLTPIKGTFDTQIVQQTKNRLQITPLYEKSENAQPSPTKILPTPLQTLPSEPTISDKPLTP